MSTPCQDLSRENCALAGFYDGKGRDEERRAKVVIAIISSSVARRVGHLQGAVRVARSDRRVCRQGNAFIPAGTSGKSVSGSVPINTIRETSGGTSIGVVSVRAPTRCHCRPPFSPSRASPPLPRMTDVGIDATNRAKALRETGDAASNVTV